VFKKAEYDVPRPGAQVKNGLAGMGTGCLDKLLSPIMIDSEAEDVVASVITDSHRVKNKVRT
jgi:hypothetical protein